MINDNPRRHMELHQKILAELGHSLEFGAEILDFGCGNGDMVEQYCQAGYNAFGCDIRIEHESERVRKIDDENYCIPFADNRFDFVFSDQVLEHVQDHARAFAEISRVMKPGAISLHIFPARLKLREDHVFVPLAGVIQSHWWLTLWALLGIRNSFQRGKSFREVAALNAEYLKNRTNYLSKSGLVEAASPCVEKLTFAEKHMIKHTYGRARHIYPLLKPAPFIASLYSAFYCRVICFQKADCTRERC